MRCAPRWTSAVVRFAASAGVTYHVMIATYATPPVPAPVTFTLREPPPPPDNDDFDTARVIPGLPFDDYADTTDATAAPDDPWCYNAGATVWYSFTPAEDVRVEIDTADSGYPTTLSAFTGPRGALVSFGCNVFNGPGGSARIRFDARAGETYHVMVGAYFQSNGGPLSFHARVAPPPFRFALSVDPTGSVTPSTGTATLHGSATCSEPAFIYGYGVLRQDRPGGSIDGWLSTSASSATARRLGARPPPTACGGVEGARRSSTLAGGPTSRPPPTASASTRARPTTSV